MGARGLIGAKEAGPGTATRVTAGGAERFRGVHTKPVSG